MTDLLKFVHELCSHRLIQRFNNTCQLGFRIYQVIVLGLQQRIPLADFFIFINRIDIDTAKFAYFCLIIAGHFSEPGAAFLFQRFAAQRCGALKCQLVFFPHIIAFRGLGGLSFFNLMIKPEYFLIQRIHAFRKFFTFGKKVFMTGHDTFFFGNCLLNLLCQVLYICFQLSKALFTLKDLGLLLLSIIIKICSICFQLFAVFFIFAQFAAYTPDIFCDKFIFLGDAGYFKANPGIFLIETLFLIGCFFEPAVQSFDSFLSFCLNLIIFFK